MGKSKYLTERARKVILERMHDAGEMTKAEISDLIRPHYMFDAQAAKEREIGQMANRLVRSLRDSGGVRSCFKLNGSDVYVNVDRCDDKQRVGAIENQLQAQIDGLTKSRNKTHRRYQELDGQISLGEDVGT